MSMTLDFEPLRGEFRYVLRAVPDSMKYELPDSFFNDGGVWVTYSPSAAMQMRSYATERTSKLLDRLEARKVMGRASVGSAGAEAQRPDGLEYRPFQIAGIEYLVQMKKCILADEPGSGKTIQVAGAVNEIRPSKLLILCPASLRLNWRRELDKWLTHNLERLDIVSYDSSWRAKMSKDLLSANYDMVVMDEAHYLKNPTSKRSRFASALVRSTERVVMLTGTPIVNRPIELYSLLSILSPKWLMQRKSFECRYCDAHYENIFVRGGQRRRVWDVSGASNLSELYDIVSSYVMIRRRRTEVLDQIPLKQRVLSPIEPESEKAKNLVAELKEHYLKQIMKAFHCDKSFAEKIYKADWTELDKLGLSAEEQDSLFHHVTVPFEEYAAVRHDLGVEKAPFAVDYIKTLLDGMDDGEKVVVFAHHKDVVDALYDGLKDYCPVKLVGGMSDKAKEDAVQSFQNDPEVRVFIGNIRAAGVGHTLTASHTVVFCELDFAPGNMLQAEDRCCRIGSEAKYVDIHVVFMDGTLDANIYSMLIKKQGVIDEAIDGNA